MAEEKVLLCPRCHLPTPKICKWTTACGSYAECPRCMYPQYREGGTWHHSMPDVFLKWYEARGML